MRIQKSEDRSQKSEVRRQKKNNTIFIPAPDSSILILLAFLLRELSIVKAINLSPFPFILDKPSE